jgi:ABC-type sugar transport system substrate-binding protein
MAALIVAALLSVAACSSSSSSSTTAGSNKGQASSVGSSPASSGSSAVVSQSKQFLQTAVNTAITGPSVGIVPADQIVPWKQSLMPTPSKLVSGKSIRVDVVYDIPTGFSPYSAHLIQAIGAKLGWQVKVFAATAPTPQAAEAAMQTAVLDKPTAIIAAVIPATYDGQALAEAKAAGIYTILMHQDTTTGSGYDAYVPDGEGVQKALLAAYAVAESNGTAKSLLLGGPGFSDVNLPAAQAYLKQCATCSTSTGQFNPVDFTDPVKVQSDVSAALANVSGLDYVMWPDGGLPLTSVVAAISASPNKNAKLLVNDASAGSIQLLKSGAIPIVVEAPSALIALIAMDDVNRLAQGQQPLAEDALRFPISYWTTANSPNPTFEAITAAQLKQSDWLTPFETAWSVQLKSAILGVNS